MALFPLCLDQGSIRSATIIILEPLMNTDLQSARSNSARLPAKNGRGRLGPTNHSEKTCRAASDADSQHEMKMTQKELALHRGASKNKSLSVKSGTLHVCSPQRRLEWSSIAESR